MMHELWHFGGMTAWGLAVVVALGTLLIGSYATVRSRRKR